MPNPIIDIGYRYATQRYEGDGTTTDWDFNFAGPAPGYLDATHIRCSFVDYNVTRIETPIPSNQVSLIGVNRIRVIPAIPAGVTLVIRRDTPKAQPEVDYTEGGILNEKNLDTTTRQAIYAAAEMVDYFADLLVDFASLDQNAFEAVSLAQNALTVANQSLLIAQQAYDTAQQALGNSAAALLAAQQAALDALNAAASAASALAAANQAALDAAAAQQAAQDALNILETISSGAVSSVQIIGQMEVAFNIIGKLDVVSEEVCRYIAGNPFTIDAGTGSARGFVSLRIAPQSNMAFQIFKNATQIGNISVNASSNTGTITITTASSFVPGDTLTVVNTTADALAETLSITLKGRRT